MTNQRIPIGSEVSSDNTEIEHVYLDTHNNIIETTTIPYDVLPEKDFATVNRKGKPWTKDEEERLVQFFHSGTNFQTIADLIGRTEVAIRARLYKLGLISSIYDQDQNLHPVLIILAKSQQKNQTLLLKIT